MLCIKNLIQIKTRVATLFVTKTATDLEKMSMNDFIR
jgi:hypothetical protein